jgi:mannose-6-phosphate isomerase-like protein (cupin superfamily)
VLNLATLAARLSEPWSPRVVAQLNDHAVKLAALAGEFGWHQHADEDELFLVLQGRLRLLLPAGAIELGPGELCVVPRGCPHNPQASADCRVVLIEPLRTRHAGTCAHPLARSLDEQLRPL